MDTAVDARVGLACYDSLLGGNSCSSLTPAVQSHSRVVVGWSVLPEDDIIAVGC